MATTCLLHGGYHPHCADCLVTAKSTVHLYVNDFLLLMTTPYPTRREEYRFGRVRYVDDKGRATGYADGRGVSRIVGSIRYTWGISKFSLRDPARFWEEITARKDEPFLTFADAYQFVRPHSIFEPEPVAVQGHVKQRRSRS